MWDNRGDWDAAHVASGRGTFEDRLFANLSSLARSAGQLAAMIAHRSDLYWSRQDLRGLSDEHLRDIGVTRRQAEIEASRPFFPE
ncbi:hypothetical protein ASG43_09005 [Aureimonas sp. Leaf454]|uniref:DUF1127 domain-containing protein n=1 Tax=Aureimonas sp. Leaf454 TaxID=1736381 RepID=UPI0006FBFAAE|nr:hypothetical protein [Aureimonas sp. Leaf454]KQT48960.1 hypothetical protein ASG43_09005 [Aureimonas sp. Leaf454]